MPSDSICQAPLMRNVDGCDVFAANYIDNNNMTVMRFDQTMLSTLLDVTLFSINVICHRLESFNSS